MHKLHPGQAEFIWIFLFIYGKSSWLGRCFKKQAQWDNNCLFSEQVSLYKRDTDQDDL